MPILNTSPAAVPLSMPISETGWTEPRYPNSPWSSLPESVANHWAVQNDQEKAFNQSCIDAIREYEETGLHVTLEELDAWLATWGTPDERPAPPCHL